MTSGKINLPARVPPLSHGSPSNTLSPYFSESLHNWDSQLSLRIHEIGLKIPRFFLQALEYSGDGLFWIPATAALCWAPDFTLQHFFKSLFVGFMFDLFVIGTIKALIRRPRPVYNRGMYLVVSVDHYSFPSGHSSRAFLIFVFVLEYATDWKETIFQALWVFVGDLNEAGNVLGHFDMLGYYVIPFIFACWAIATASSRILLGRHFLLDVVVGSFLGILEALFVIRVLLELKFLTEEQQRWLLECGHHFKEAMLKFV
eukprot:c43737_g1_i1 orf=56-829(-)